MEPHEIPQHCTCLVEGTIPIVFAHAILLQEVILEHSCNLERNFVILSKGTFPDKLYNFREVLFLLKNFFRLRSQFDETWFGVFVVWFQNFGILGVGKGPVDRREMFALGEFLVKTPEDLHNSESG